MNPAFEAGSNALKNSWDQHSGQRKKAVLNQHGLFSNEMKGLDQPFFMFWTSTRMS